MNAYSKDLRKKIVEALGRGANKSGAARAFGISRSSVKRYAKLAEARTREALIGAMGQALDAVSVQYARGFFAHCGYRSVDQPL